MIKGVLPNDCYCLFNRMQDVNFSFGPAYLDVKLQSKMFIHPISYLFVCFYVR